METKKCSSCKNDIDLNLFRKNGKYLASVCNVCAVENNRETHLRNKYGITLDFYDKLLEKQNYVCAICNLTNNNGYKLCVDHCHTTGKIRGLLCHTCNTALGKFKDNEELLINAIKYLKKYEK